MTTNICVAHALSRQKALPRRVVRPLQPGAADAMLEFGRFRVLLRRRQLVADGMPIVLGTRAFDLLMVLLEADGSLVSKDELMRRVWQGVIVAEENLKVQIYGLRRALGEDRGFIRTEFGHGYRLTAKVSSSIARNPCEHGSRRSCRPSQWLSRHCSSRRKPRGLRRSRKSQPDALESSLVRNSAAPWIS